MKSAGNTSSRLFTARESANGLMTACSHGSASLGELYRLVSERLSDHITVRLDGYSLATLATNIAGVNADVDSGAIAFPATLAGWADAIVAEFDANERGFARAMARDVNLLRMFMSAAMNETEWNARATAVKGLCGGYPPTWRHLGQNRSSKEHDA